VKRNSNFELLRIFCMIFIVFGHLFGQGIGLDNLSVPNSIFAHSVGSFSRIAVNLFVMISAWFMMEKEFKAERVLKIYAQTWSYSVGLTFLSCLCGGGKISKGAIINMLFPFLRLSVWYVSVHISLMLISPFLNCVKRWNIKQLRSLVLILLMLTSVMSTLKGLQENYLSWFMWFIFVYLFVIYLKQFALEQLRPIKSIVFLFGGLFGYSVVVCMKIFAYRTNLQIYNILAQWLSDPKSLIDFFISGFLFIFFARINMGFNKTINFIASSAFSVYVFHQIPAFYTVLWNSILKVSIWRNDMLMPIYAILTVIIVYALGIVLNLIYKHMLEEMFIRNRISQAVINKIDKLYNSV